MDRYEVSFSRKNSDIYQAMIVNTKKSPVEVGLWFKENKPEYSIIGITIATVDSMKPGKSIITI